MGRVRVRNSRRYRSPNFREQYMNVVSVDADGRVYLFDEQASSIVVEDRFHFFEEVLDPDDWERVRAFYNLPKLKRHSNRSHGVRRGEGDIVGTAPKRPIHIIQDERGKEAGEKSWRMPAYGKAFERMVKKDMAEAGVADSSQDFSMGGDEDDSPFSSKDVPF